MDSKTQIPIDRLPRVVGEYFEDQTNFRKHTHYDELFNANKDNVDLQTQVSEQELRAICVLLVDDDYLKKMNVKPFFYTYIDRFMRLKISLDRQSRKEYVEVNKNDQSEQQFNALQRIGAGFTAAGGGMKK